ncbi:MAG: ATP-binding protein [Acetobacteraceae bacterium]
MSLARSRIDLIRMLQVLLVASILLPVLVFLGGSYLEYRATAHAARDTLIGDLAISAEQVGNILDTSVLIAEHVADLVRGASDAAVRADEAGLHSRLLAMEAEFPQIANIAIIGPEGDVLATAHAFPLEPMNIADRSYFQEIRAGSPRSIVSVQAGRLVGVGVFALAIRRPDAAGRFDGLVVVSVPSSYFHAFYGRLFEEDRSYSAGVFREDGASLARYPEIDPNYLMPKPGDLMMGAIARDPAGGVVWGRSRIDRRWRVIAYRHLDRYPVYVSDGRTWNSVVAAWLSLMATHLIFGLPATLALFSLTLLGLRVARRERAAADALQREADRREAAEAALRQAQKMEAVGQLTGGIAHDFNNLLTVIGSNLELLLRRAPPDSESLLRHARGAMEGVRRAAALTHRLLAFSRQQPLTPAIVDLGQLVADMSDLLRRTLGERVTVETVLAAGLWPVRVDANQIENALLNLAVNARDAMPDGGRLTIETANAELDDAQTARAEVPPGRYVVLAVSDTGIGMAPEVAARVFDPFFTTKPVGEGTGLGLSMVYGFVKQSGGHVTIRSVPEKGTTVRLYLPSVRVPED